MDDHALLRGLLLLRPRLPGIVSVVVATILVLFVGHALLAVRKFPINYAQWRSFRTHMAHIKHEDTTLWFWQVVTGFALFFLATIHLYVMLTQPGKIGPYESADRVWSDVYWPLYLVLLFVVEIHGGIGLYRLCIKWGWFGTAERGASRRRLKVLKWALTAFFLVLGLATLAAYIKIGHRARAEPRREVHPGRGSPPGKTEAR